MNTSAQRAYYRTPPVGAEHPKPAKTAAHRRSGTPKAQTGRPIEIQNKENRIIHSDLEHWLIYIKSQLKLTCFNDKPRLEAFASNKEDSRQISSFCADIRENEAALKLIEDKSDELRELMGQFGANVNLIRNAISIEAGVVSYPKFHFITLAAAVIKQESQGNPEARSSAGALGLMQLMPKTAVGILMKFYDEILFYLPFKPNSPLFRAMEAIRKFNNYAKNNNADAASIQTFEGLVKELKITNTYILSHLSNMRAIMIQIDYLDHKTINSNQEAKDVRKALDNYVKQYSDASKLFINGVQGELAKRITAYAKSNNFSQQTLTEASAIAEEITVKNPQIEEHLQAMFYELQSYNFFTKDAVKKNDQSIDGDTDLNQEIRSIKTSFYAHNAALTKLFQASTVGINDEVWSRAKNIFIEDKIAFNPAINAAMGVYYLAYLVDKYADKHYTGETLTKLVLAAYNAGPTAVDNLLVECEGTDHACSGDHSGGKFFDNLPAEARDYIQKVTAYDRAFYSLSQTLIGQALGMIKNKPR